MWNNLTLSAVLPAIKDVVDSGNEAMFTPEGRSMKPMLSGGRDKIVLVKPVFPLKKYDLPLYVRKSGQIVLHRVIKSEKTENGYVYTMRGDNTYINEPDIREEQIAAVVSRFCRKGKWYDVNSNMYKLYVRVWNCIFPFRRFVRFSANLLLRAVRKIKKQLV